MEKYILALDQGTTSSRAILFDHHAQILAVAQKEFTQHFPKSGWVEHDPNEIWSSQVSVAAEVLAKAGKQAKDLAAIGITNQRETTVVWERKTGRPLCNAIVWQDRRTAGICDQLRADGKAPLVKEKTGLPIDAYFSATKIQWILENVPGARALAEAGELAFGTVDSWLTWKFTGGKRHVTDVSNASRTMLYNIRTLCWDEELLALFHIPVSMLPEVCSSSEVYGHTDSSIFSVPVPIAGIAGDQQAALFGQACFEPGLVKNTYGTGCFIMVNAGNKPLMPAQILSTVAWKIGDEVTYALEGSIFIGGALVQWLRDGLGLFDQAREIEPLALSVPDCGGVYLVPAFAGLGSPYWDSYARGLMIGITRGTTKAHISRAALDAIAFQVKDVIDEIKAAGIEIKELRVDGGASANNNLMQLQSDALGMRVIRPKITETTALGAAYLAGLAVGFWKNMQDIREHWQQDRVFEPGKNASTQQLFYRNWKKAVDRSRGWLKELEDNP